MKLPFVDKLEAVVLGRTAQPFPPPYISMKHTEEPPRFESLPDWVDFETRCILGYRQTAPAEAAEQVKRDTIRALTHHLYGDIQSELIEVAMDLRRSGMMPDSEPLLRLENLIKDLTP